MKTFRYKIVKTRTDLSETKLNEFGGRGFDLTGVVTDEYGYTYYFKIETETNG